MGSLLIKTPFTRVNGVSKYCYFFNIFFNTVSLSNFLVQKNQSQHFILSSCFSILSFATPQVPAVGTMTSSPGLQSAGVATPNSSAAYKAMTTRYNSSKLRPKLNG